MTAQNARARIIAALDRLDDASLVLLADLAEHPETIPVPRQIRADRAKALARDVLDQARRHFRGER